MAIERIETFVLQAALSGGDVFYSSQGSFHSRSALLVRLTTSDGLQGWGESGVSMPVPHLATYIHEVLASRVLGRDETDITPLWNELYCFSRDFGRKGASVDAISGINTALWDLRGKALGQPIHALMGGAFRRSVRAYATGLYYRPDDLTDPAGAVTRVRDEAAGFLAAGFTAIKGKVGLLALPDDIRRMAALRDEAGADALLMTDANHGYNRAHAKRMGRALERLGFHWFEEPLVPEDIEGAAQLRRELDVAIAGGECEYTRWGMRDLLAGGAVDILQPDLSASGGVGEGQRILALASAFHTPVCFHVWGSGVAVAAALQMTALVPPTPYTVRPLAPENEPLFEFDRTRNPLRDDLVRGGFPLKDACLEIPSGPGLGIEIDEAVVRTYATAGRMSER